MLDEKNEYLFFFQCQIGLSDLAIFEFKQKWPHLFESKPIPEINQSEEGFEIAADCLEVIRLTPYLKTINRVLLRVEEFKCRDLPKLFKKIQKINWNALIGSNIPELKVFAKRSRLIHTRKIEETILEAISKYQKANPCSKQVSKMVDQNKATVYFRFYEDVLTISLDTTGEHLYKRGDRDQIGVAPLRETLAAAICCLAIKTINRQINSIVDPMSGSAQILREFLLWNRPMKRSFDYEWLPLFEKANIKGLSVDLGTTEVDKVFAFDNDRIMIELAKNRLDRLCDSIVVEEKDFFQNNFEEVPKQSVFFLNPPYGKRIKLPSKPHLFFESLLEKIMNSKKAASIFCIVPKFFIRSIPQNINLIANLETNNGGIPVVILGFEIKT